MQLVSEMFTYKQKDDKIKEIGMLYLHVYKDECNQNLDAMYRYQGIII